jgi:methylthioribose-1-phosphate isomerase
MSGPIRWNGESLELLDQTRLPHEETWLSCSEPGEVADAIRRLAVRGAPAIGIAAAYGAALSVTGARCAEEADIRFGEACDLLGGTRPTAVNLGWALARARGAFEAARREGEDPFDALVALADSIHTDQMESDERMAELGAALVEPGSRVLTHCNTGPLATGGRGTAGGVIEAAWRDGKVELVWVDETRPLLQGARLTAWELGRAGVPFRVSPDNGAGILMARGLVDRVFVGADRIAANGDVANKVGTYTVAVLAHRHGVPFHVVAPLSTIDPRTDTGDSIEIEERGPAEVTEVLGATVAPVGADAVNFAFDVTPADLVTSIVTEAGVLEPPYKESISLALGR